MTDIDRDRILAALAQVVDPASGRDVVSLGLVSGIVVRGGNVGFALEVDATDAATREPLRQACERAVRALPGVTSASVVLTAERAPGGRPAGPPPTLGRPATPRPASPAPGIARIIAVASGKGGVGKSTTAINLACGLALEGLRTGLLDADIYGPSIPRMAGVSGRPRSDDGKRMIPMTAHGLKLMSIGFMIDEETPMIWRGPMVQGALMQMLRDVAWGELDVLVVDMPPGTGDAQLTMAQATPLAGAVIVSTPQDLALIDARRGVAMFKRVEVPILGIVENMATFVCPHCGEASHIFGHGGARAEAQKLGVPFLGEVPLNMVIRETSDGGRPVVAVDPDSPQAQAYRTIARAVWDGLSGGQGARAAPRIVIE
jgi:ATP-binding protein involved in chromosome partitioning